MYQGIADASNPLFQATVDDETLEEIVPSYDMTVFVKNPNIYKLSDKTEFTDEAVPGWVVPEGYNRPQLSWGWGTTRGTAEIAEDCMFQTWGGQYRVQQTITDLPAGVYSIKIGFGERCNPDAEKESDQGIPENSKVFAYGSDSIAVEALAPYIGQSFPYANVEIEEYVVVTDGELTIGAEAFGEKTHTFFSDVRLLLVEPATGFDYASEYAKLNEQIETGVEAPAAARVRGIELYDLNGRRIITAQKGIQIVKKYMSDGTVRIEKVIKK